jgi:hypothetical protein
MPEWKSDPELFSLCTRELYTPVVGDILDELGFTHQFLPQPIQPAREEMKLVRPAHRGAGSASARRDLSLQRR